MRNYPPFYKHSSGFALIATVSVMTLLALVALAMLGLSSVELRSSRQSKAMTEARANARMALMIALGELQKQAGPDQRITATADILDQGSSSSHRGKMTGVWRSWENLNDGLIASPGSYKNEKENRFLGWLVSSKESEDYSLSITAGSNNSIRLAGTEGGNGDNSPVYAELVPINSPTTNTSSTEQGNFAYAVLDEGVKAKGTIYNKDAPGDTLSDVAHYMRLSSAPRYAPEAIGKPFDSIDPSNTNISKALTLPQFSLLSQDITSKHLAENFHALTPWSMGLLVDVNRGGFKKDLSLATEAPGLPNGIRNDNYTKPLYPCEWNLLYDFCRQYKRLQYTNSGKQVLSQPSYGSPNPSVHTQVRRFPVLASVRNIISYHARRQTPTSATYDVGILMTPVITLWNPYNVELRLSGSLNYRVASLPFSLQFKVNGVTKPWRHFSDIASPSQGTNYGFYLRPNQNGQFVLKPGESLLFSPASGQVRRGGGNILLAVGYRHSGGFFYSRELNRGQPLTAAGNASLSLAIKPDISKDDFQDWAVAYHIDGYHNGQWIDIQRLNASDNSLTRFLTTLSHADTRDVSTSAAANDLPVCASMNVQLQTAVDSTAPSLGLVQTNPLVSRSEYGRYGTIGSNNGDLHKQPLSQAWIDISTHAHPDWDDSYLPQVDAKNHGFVASGVRADSGVPYAQIVELPLRPLQSIPALQHFNYAVNHFWAHPFQLTGNAVAPPMIAPGEIKGGPVIHWSNNYMHQDFHYLANALLFDRYFFSSIAPRADVFTNQPESSESLKSVYQSHINGTKPLPNNRYLPYGKTSDKDVDNPSSDYETIASKLIIDGPFNVNSTSVAAWKSFLGSLNRERVPYRDIYNSPDTIAAGTASTSHPYIVSRFALPGGDSADTAAANPNEIPEELFWRGYRSLTQDQIDVLAEKIVEQVKLRGPFLSLAEFVNRRLSSSYEDRDLAKRGTIQAALDDPAVTINKELQQATASQEITEDIVKDFEDYVFPEAATGYTAFAAPGWVTQADILRPLAPYMTPRSDTFRIRAYGESKSTQGKVIARIWCEAIVQRVPEYIAPSEEIDGQANNGNAPTESLLTNTGNKNPAFNDLNRKFGRQFRIVHFRWLNQDEI